jgi:hypothetical protein
LRIRVLATASARIRDRDLDGAFAFFLFGPSAHRLHFLCGMLTSKQALGHKHYDGQSQEYNRQC